MDVKLGRSKRTLPTRKECSSCMWNETIILSGIKLSPEELISESVMFTVKTYSVSLGVCLIGQASISLSTVRESSNNFIHQEWILLSHPEAARERVGYILVSIGVFGVSDVVQSNYLFTEDDEEARASTSLMSRALLPPDVRATPFCLTLNVMRGENFPRFNDDQAAVFVRLICGGAHETIYGRAQDRSPSFNMKLWVPVLLPSLESTARVIVGVGDPADASRAIIIGHISLPIEALLASALTPKWLGFYWLPKKFEQGLGVAFNKSYNKAANAANAAVDALRSTALGFFYSGQKLRAPDEVSLGDDGGAVDEVDPEATAVEEITLDSPNYNPYEIGSKTQEACAVSFGGRLLLSASIFKSRNPSSGVASTAAAQAPPTRAYTLWVDLYELAGCGQFGDIIVVIKVGASLFASETCAFDSIRQTYAWLDNRDPSVIEAYAQECRSADEAANSKKRSGNATTTIPSLKEYIKSADSNTTIGGGRLTPITVHLPNDFSSAPRCQLFIVSADKFKEAMNELYKRSNKTPVDLTVVKERKLSIHDIKRRRTFTPLGGHSDIGLGVDIESMKYFVAEISFSSIFKDNIIKTYKSISRELNVTPAQIEASVTKLRTPPIQQLNLADIKTRKCFPGVQLICSLELVPQRDLSSIKHDLRPFRLDTYHLKSYACRIGVYQALGLPPLSAPDVGMDGTEVQSGRRIVRMPTTFIRVSVGGRDRQSKPIARCISPSWFEVLDFEVELPTSLDVAPDILVELVSIESEITADICSSATQRKVDQCGMLDELYDPTADVILRKAKLERLKMEQVSSGEFDFDDILHDSESDDDLIEGSIPWLRSFADCAAPELIQDRFKQKLQLHKILSDADYVTNHFGSDRRRKKSLRQLYSPDRNRVTSRRSTFSAKVEKLRFGITDDGEYKNVFSSLQLPKTISGRNNLDFNDNKNYKGSRNDDEETSQNDDFNSVSSNGDRHQSRRTGRNSLPINQLPAQSDLGDDDGGSRARELDIDRNSPLSSNDRFFSADTPGLASLPNRKVNVDSPARGKHGSNNINSVKNAPEENFLFIANSNSMNTRNPKMRGDSFGNDGGMNLFGDSDEEREELSTPRRRDVSLPVSPNQSPQVKSRYNYNNNQLGSPALTSFSRAAENYFEFEPTKRPAGLMDEENEPAANSRNQSARKNNKNYLVNEYNGHGKSFNDNDTDFDAQSSAKSLPDEDGVDIERLREEAEVEANDVKEVVLAFAQLAARKLPASYSEPSWIPLTWTPEGAKRAGVMSPESQARGLLGREPRVLLSFEFVPKEVADSISSIIEPELKRVDVNLGIIGPRLFKWASLVEGHQGMGRDGMEVRLCLGRNPTASWKPAWKCVLDTFSRGGCSNFLQETSVSISLPYLPIFQPMLEVWILVKRPPNVSINHESQGSIQRRIRAVGLIPLGPLRPWIRAEEKTSMMKFFGWVDGDLNLPFLLKDEILTAGENDARSRRTKRSVHDSAEVSVADSPGGANHAHANGGGTRSLGVGFGQTAVVWPSASYLKGHIANALRSDSGEGALMPSVLRPLEGSREEDKVEVEERENDDDDDDEEEDNDGDDDNDDNIYDNSKKSGGMLNAFDDYEETESVRANRGLLNASSSADNKPVNFGNSNSNNNKFSNRPLSGGAVDSTNYSKLIPFVNILGSFRFKTLTRDQHNASSTPNSPATPQTPGSSGKGNGGDLNAGGAEVDIPLSRDMNELNFFCAHPTLQNSLYQTDGIPDQIMEEVEKHLGAGLTNFEVYPKSLMRKNKMRERATLNVKLETLLDAEAFPYSRVPLMGVDGSGQVRFWGVFKIVCEVTANEADIQGNQPNLLALANKKYAETEEIDAMSTSARSRGGDVSSIMSSREELSENTGGSDRDKDRSVSENELDSETKSKRTKVSIKDGVYDSSSRSRNDSMLHIQEVFRQIIDLENSEFICRFYCLAGRSIVVLKDSNASAADGGAGQGDSMVPRVLVHTVGQTISPSMSSDIVIGSTASADPAFGKLVSRSLVFPKDAVMCVTTTCAPAGSLDIGSFVGTDYIDVEDRILHPTFKAYVKSKNMPVEMRSMNADGSRFGRGVLFLWNDIFNLNATGPGGKAIDIPPEIPLLKPDPEAIILRVKVTGIKDASMDEADSIHLFVRCKFQDQKGDEEIFDTDVHYWSTTGRGVYSKLFVWKTEAPTSYPCLTVQIHSYTMTTATSSLVGETTLNLESDFARVKKSRKPLLLRPGWVRALHPNFGTNPRGNVEIELQILSVDAASQIPAPDTIEITVGRDAIGGSPFVKAVIDAVDAIVGNFRMGMIITTVLLIVGGVIFLYLFLR